MLSKSEITLVMLYVNLKIMAKFQILNTFNTNNVVVFFTDWEDIYNTTFPLDLHSKYIREGNIYANLRNKFEYHRDEVYNLDDIEFEHFINYTNLNSNKELQHKISLIKRNRTISKLI